jgi:hypothetical protein
MRAKEKQETCHFRDRVSKDENGPKKINEK